MKITIVLTNGKRHTARQLYQGSSYVVIATKCPHGCAAPVNATRDEVQLKVSGTGIKHRTHDTYFADAVALCCMRKIGTIETKVETIFGIEEDERVMNGPWRVY